MPSKYKSDLERLAVRKFRTLKKKFKYESEELPYISTYIPDFTLEDDTIVETKGYLDPDDIRKMRAVKKAHPNRRIILCFQRPHSKVHRRKCTHAEWAEMNGFEWCSISTLKDII